MERLLARRRWVSVLTDAYHNELARRTVSYFTGAATFLGAISLARPDLLPSWDWWIWAGGGVAIAAVALIVSIPRGSHIYTHEQGGWSIELARGDLLDHTSAVIVTGDRNASSTLAAVGDSSLIGQVIRRWYGGDGDAFTAEIQRGLQGRGLDGGHPQCPLDLGMLIPFGDGTSRSAFLFCLADRTPTGPRTEWRDLSLAYARLWEGLRDKQLPAVTCPIIGAGFAGSSLSARGTLIFLLLGFHGVSLERRVTRRLRVIISDDDFDSRMYRTTRAMLGELGYRR